MPEAAIDADGDGDDADREVVEHERAELREFVEGLSLEDINCSVRCSATAARSSWRRLGADLRLFTLDRHRDILLPGNGADRDGHLLVRAGA